MRKIRIIIVDDDDLTSYMFKRWLSEMGYEVLTYKDPTMCPLYNEKTEQCMKERPCADIIFTDLKMLHMGGIEFLQYQSQRGCKLDIKNKAIISGYIDDESRKAIEKLGCSFFEKPLELSLIAKWLKECEKRIDLSMTLDNS